MVKAVEDSRTPLTTKGFAASLSRYQRIFQKLPGRALLGRETPGHSPPWDGLEAHPIVNGADKGGGEGRLVSCLVERYGVEIFGFEVRAARRAEGRTYLMTFHERTLL